MQSFMICFAIFLQMKSAPHLTAHVQVSIVFLFLIFYMLCKFCKSIGPLLNEVKSRISAVC